jgi:hypothetical protein
MHVLHVCIPLLCLFGARWRLSVAQFFAAPVVAAKVDDGKACRDIVLQEEVKMRESVRILVVSSKPALYSGRKPLAFMVESRAFVIVASPPSLLADGRISLIAPPVREPG